MQRRTRLLLSRPSCPMHVTPLTCTTTITVRLSRRHLAPSLAVRVPPIRSSADTTEFRFHLAPSSSPFLVDYAPTREYFITNPDAPVASMIPFKRSDTVDSGYNSASSDIPSLAYQNTLNSTPYDTPKTPSVLEFAIAKSKERLTGKRCLRGSGRGSVRVSRFWSRSRKLPVGLVR
ncbi:hypothetical protein FRB95_002535 [Tulasnella sp. JGI-2019a]|nr:hypothetical protein FRB95_002535 [Tulasnella sp. JGI-2019a]